MIDMHIHHTFWCFNENSGDTGGLVWDDFGQWDEEKYALVKPALWQDDNGVFISLDHQRPVGANGQSLSEYYGGGTVTKPSTETTTSTTATTTTASDTTGGQAKPMYGDVDLNGEVELRDAVTLCKAIAGIEGADLSVAQSVNADCDGKAGIDGKDLTMLLMVLAGTYEQSALRGPDQA